VGNQTRAKDSNEDNRNKTFSVGSQLIGEIYGLKIANPQKTAEGGKRNTTTTAIGGTTNFTGEVKTVSFLSTSLSKPMEPSSPIGRSYTNNMFNRMKF